MARAPGPGSHLCGHPNKYKRRGQKRPGHCEHIVADASEYRYCEDHRHGWRECCAQLFPDPSHRPARRDSTLPLNKRCPVNRSGPTESGSARVRSGQVWKDRGVPEAAVGIAVEQARKVATDDWVRRSGRRVVSALSAEVAQQARSRGASVLCNELADLAAALLAAKGWAIRAVEGTVFPLLGWFSSPSLTRLIARQFAKQLVSASGVEVTATVHALRAYGVLLCVLDDRDLEQCQCLRQVAASGSPQRIRAQVRMIVGHGLEPLA